MYGWAITCSETSSSLGVSHAGFWAGIAFSVLISSARFAVSIVRFNSLIILSVKSQGHSSADCIRPYQRLPGVGLRVTRGIVDRVAHKLAYCITPPASAVGLPGLSQRLVSQIRTDLGKRRSKLHPAIGQDEQRRRRHVEAGAQTVGDREEIGRAH